MKISRFSLVVIGFEITFAILFFTGAMYPAGAVLIVLVGFLVQNLICSQWWGTPEIQKYSLYSTLLASTLLISFFNLIELPSFLTQEILTVAVLGVSGFYAISRDPFRGFHGSGRFGKAQRDLWKT